MNRIFVALFAIAFATTAVRECRWSEAAHDVAPAEVAPAPLPGGDGLAAAVAHLESRVAALTAPPPPETRSPMEELTTAMFDSAKGAVELAISLVGAMALFLGFMRIAEDGGMLQVVARLLRPLMTRLFPDVPPDHPAMGAMILNFSANALGLGNAATPFGIRAMQDLDRLNPQPGTATDAMVLFLAINTSNVALLPNGVMGIRGAMGSHDIAGIMPTTLFGTLCSTSVAILACTAYKRFVAPNRSQYIAEHAVQEDAEALPEAASEAYPTWVSGTALLVLVLAVPLTLMYGRIIAPWILPAFALSLVGYGAARGVAVYESFVEGAKQGFEVAIKIIPYLVAILTAVGMVRSSGALGAFVEVVGPITSRLGMPAEALPMALIRPLSGSGAMGVLMDTLQQEGPDSYTGYLVSTLQGSTETTFYVIAVYFGAVGVRRIRHAMVSALTADLAGVVAAVVAVQLYFRFNGLW